MATPNIEAEDKKIAVNRLESLTDGIFAIVMTLLVLTITLPQKNEELADQALHIFLFSQAQQIFNFALSFILLANFWIGLHQQYYYIRHTNRIHLWINLILLLTIVTVPFSTSIVGDFPKELSAQIFFAVNMFVIGILFLANWIYATSKYRLVTANLASEHIILGIKRSLVLPVVSLLAVCAAFIKPLFGSYMFILAPIASFLPFLNRKDKNLA